MLKASHSRHFSVLATAILLILGSSLVVTAAVMLSRATRGKSNSTESSGATAPSTSAALRDAVLTRAEARYGELPLRFESNKGQTDDQVRFRARGYGYSLFLTPAEAVLALRSSAGRESVLRMSLVGGNTSPDLSGEELLNEKSNYIIGGDPSRWHTGVETYARVKYSDVYPGVDMVYYGNQQELEYDFIVAPFADPKIIRLDFTGARKLEMGTEGDLVLHTAGGYVRQRKPLIYQEVNGDRRQIDGKYVLTSENRVGFEIGDYDASRPLTIDPVLVYSTYLGGGGADSAQSIAIDADGNAYIAGFTSSVNFPTLNPAQANLNGTYSDVFVTKLNAAGTAVIYSTYVGGSGGEIGHGIDVDAAGNAYVSGVTTNTQSSVSNDFPIVNAYDATFSGYDAAFLFKLNASGSALLYSTYLGDSDPNIAREVAVDRASGEAYVVADSASGNCPTPTGGTQPCDGSLVAKFNSAGNALVYAFIIDRSSAGYDIAVDPAGSAYVTGSTLSDFFPVTPGAYQRVCTGCNLGRSDAYVVKLNPQGTNFVYATYLGGSQGDSGYSIAADNSGNAYVTGNTGSSSATTKPFPTTPGAYQTEGNSGSVFVTKLNASGSALLYSTYFGGNVREEARGIAVDSFGNVYFTGYTRSLNFPTANPVQPTPTQSGTSYVFVSALDASGAGLLFSTFLGVGEGNYIAADSSGNVYVTGETFSDSFPTTPGAFQTANARTSGNGGNSTSLSDAFVSKIAIGNPTPTYRISGTITNNTDNASDLTVTLSGTQNRTTTARLGVNSTYIFAFDGVPAGGNYTVTPSKLNYTFDPPSRSFTNLSGSQTADFRAIPTPPNVSVNDVVVTEGDAGTVSATFRVTRSVPRGGDTVVDLDTADGTATAGSDYTATTLRLIFSGGQTEQLVTVPVISDTIAESDETFFVNLTSITNATIVDSQGIGTIVNDDGGTPTPAPSTSGLQYYALPTPVRLLDTRPGQPACVNSGTALAANGIRTEAARTPCTGIPATAKAIVGNATVVAPTDGGYITLYPSGAAQPTVSNLNFVSRQVVPNSFTVGVGAGDGAFNIYASASTHFIVDVTGYYAPPGQGGLFYHPLPRPVRLLDTRNGQQACDTPNSPLTAGGTRTETARLICSGVTIPVSAQAVVGNATVVSQSGGEGYITLFPSGANQPTVSNLNFVQGQVVPNSFTVGLGSDGAFNIYTSAATDFIVDIAGYYSTDPAPDVNGVAGLLYYPLTAPVRLLDTRSGQPACDTPNASLATNSTRTQVARRTCSGQSVPTNAQAVVGNATVVNGTQNGGYITLFPSGAAQPNVSNLNFVGGQVVPNSFTVRLGGDGAFNIYTSSSTDFIVDLAGYFAP